MSRSFPILALLLIASPVHAQDVAPPSSTYVNGILVTTGDVTTCPYRSLGALTVNMRLDLGGGGQGNMFNKLRTKAISMGADAVVGVTIGKGRVTAMSFNQKTVAGRAIQYVDRSCAPVK